MEEVEIEKKPKSLVKKVLIVVGIIILLIAIAILTTINMYNRSLRAVDLDDSEEIEVVVPTGSNYSTIADILYEHDLIRSPLTFRIHLRLNPPENKLFAGIFILRRNMDVNEIIETLGKGPVADYNTARLVIREGLRIDQIADEVSKVTNHSKEEIMDRWNSEEFVDIVIDKYWFVTEDVKKVGIRYPLEGHLFPSTYQILNDSSIDQIAFRLLDQMEIVLERHREGIESSSLSIHEILTMASIVHHEATLDEDRPYVASVFFNRIRLNMRLQTDPTIGYGLWEWKNFYTTADLNINTPYNTYMHVGLPIGPIGNPGEASIRAVINPASTNYIFFMADICSGNPKTIFAETYREHSANVCKYLGCPRKC